ncbi:MAG: hypothetical protein WBC21_00310 [Minisyncoccales bacterium]
MTETIVPIGIAIGHEFSKPISITRIVIIVITITSIPDNKENIIPADIAMSSFFIFFFFTSYFVLWEADIRFASDYIQIILC